MNTELLQQLLEMVSSAGEGSFILALVYVLYPYFNAVFWATVIWIICACIRRVVSRMSFVHDVATKVGYHIHGEADHQDRRQILNHIETLIKNQK